MMYVRTLPSMIMCSGHVRKKGRDTVKRTEMEEDVSSEMGKIRSQQPFKKKVMQDLAMKRWSKNIRSDGCNIKKFRRPKKKKIQQMSSEQTDAKQGWKRNSDQDIEESDV